jgi:two-component system, NtrC family, response regulator AtoC
MQPAPLLGGGRFRVLVVAEHGVVESHILPEAGRVTIGRGETNTICIDDASISRQHAVLHVEAAIAIEDLGSVNGTRVRGVAVPPNVMCEIDQNELITLGSMTLIVQARFSPAVAAHVVTHEYFDKRLQEECARADRSGGTFAVAGIQVTGDGPGRLVLDALTRTLRQSDVIATFGPRSFGLLLVETTAEQAEHVCRRIMRCLHEVGAGATYALAQFPDHGKTAYALLSAISGNDADDEELVIADPAMRDLHELVARIASSDLPVLILGETGVGKEKMSRAAKPFVAINCAALNDALLESELFGHERGAFTGANAVKPGLLEAAEGGTVFLDEIGEMSLAIQAKLLRVLEDGEVRRVGGLKARQIGARFIAATNVDLETSTRRGRFREDLYFRLSAATVVIPPLRDRPSEIELMARRFARRAAARAGRGPLEIAPEAMALLRTYSWPGNIRELRNVIERAVLLCSNRTIDVEHLPVERMRGSFVARTDIARGTDHRALTQGSGNDERARILEALEQVGGHQSKAAALLGISRRTLINRLEQYALPRPRKGRRRAL